MGRQIGGGWSSHTNKQKLSLTRMKEIGTRLKKKGIGGLWQTSHVRWAALKESGGAGEGVQKQGGLGLVCRGDRKPPLDR